MVAGFSRAGRGTEGLPRVSNPAITIKYFLDRVTAAILIVILLPAFILVALGVKLEDRGPIFFSQDRLGLNGKVFRIHKFRTMIPDADRLLAPDGRPKGQRITRMGRALRLCSLDELPQLYNILLGQMSFVGPRPALVSHLELYSEQQKGRFRMKPGVTGLAQVNGRNTLKWSERINYDLYYIDNYSMFLDLRIILRTVKVVISGEGIVLDRNPNQVNDLGADRIVDLQQSQGPGNTDTS